MKYLNREQTLLAMAKDKKVLHLGCVWITDPKMLSSDRFEKLSLHCQLSQISDTTGIDLNESLIEEGKKRGYFNNVMVGDVEKLENLPLEGKFDLVVAGDVIEHLSNPGLMLEGIKRFLKPDSLLLITTPNAFSLPNFLRFALGRFKESDSHVLTFNVENLKQLLARHGYLVASTDTCFERFSISKYPSGFFALAVACLKRIPRFGGTHFVLAAKAPEETSRA